VSSFTSCSTHNRSFRRWVIPGKIHQTKRIKENANASFFESSRCAVCTGHITFCYSPTSWTTELWSVMLSRHTGV